MKYKGTMQELIDYIEKFPEVDREVSADFVISRDEEGIKVSDKARFNFHYQQNAALSWLVKTLCQDAEVNKQMGLYYLEHKTDIHCYDMYVDTYRWAVFGRRVLKG